ncbi:MAG: response regulator transcription factor [Cytophagales bacterium]|nr:response regulator transcription factor [Cytophagales bacterium]
MLTSTKITIISGQILYTEALKELLINSNENFLVEGFSNYNPRIGEILRSINPDIILMDANGMGKEIWEFLHMTHLNNPDAQIIMLANSNESIYQEYASKNGANGYVLKSSPKELLIAAIKIVSKGGNFFDPGITTKINGLSVPRIQGKFNLSTREMEIIHLIKDGLSTKDIANHLALSFHTVETHRKNIYNKLSINKVTELLKLYSEFEN